MTSDMKAHRRKVLTHLIAEEGGNIREYCSAHGLQYASVLKYLNERLNEFGTRAARGLETKLGLPTYYFDEGGPGFTKPSHLSVVATSTAPVANGGANQIGRWLQMFVNSSDAKQTQLLKLVEELTKEESARSKENLNAP